VNEPQEAGALEIQVQALVARVAHATQQRCAGFEEQARLQIRQILKQARAEARARVHQAVAEERSRLEQGLRQARAQAALEQRKQQQAQLQQLLDAMWQQLPGLMAARWRDPGERRAWIEAALDAARTLLPDRPWTLEVDSDFPQEEQAPLTAQARDRGATEVTWARDARIGPGVRIRADGACLSATIPSLLARRQDIEAAFLADYLGEDAPATPAAAHEGVPGQ
jgi:hypothetical protein